MKNKSVLLITIFALLFAVLGCSYISNLQSDSNSNKTTAEKAIDSTVGEEKLGIPECDDAFDEMAKLLSDAENDSFITKTAKQAAINKIRENLKQRIEQNKSDKTQLAKDCREYKTQIDKFKTQDTNKETNKDTNKSGNF
jgi:hypothetical protein